MQAAGDAIKQVPVGSPRHLTCQSHRNIPGLVQPFTVFGEEIPQPTAMKAGTIDVDDGEENIRSDKMELLSKRVHLSNEFAFLSSDILPHAVVKPWSQPMEVDHHSARWEAHPL